MLKKDFDQQSEDQEESQALTMDAIRKIYEVLTGLNQPMPELPPSSPRRGSMRNEEMSAGTEDRRLFTPPQLPFEQSSSGNGGTTEVETPLVLDKPPTGEAMAHENERPTFD